MSNDTIDAASGATGIAIATFAIAINTLKVLEEKNIISAHNALLVIARARRVIENQVDSFPDKDALHEAFAGLIAAEQLFHTNSATPTGKEPH